MIKIFIFSAVIALSNGEYNANVNGAFFTEAECNNAKLGMGKLMEQYKELNPKMKITHDCKAVTLHKPVAATL